MTIKKKILETSKRIFNQQGFGAPTLSILSQEMNMNRGKIAYYFKDKEALLQALIEEMWLKYQLDLARATAFPSWSTTNNATKIFFELQREYAFLFYDMKAALHPDVIQLTQKMKRDMTQRQMGIINFSLQLGNMKPERIPGTYLNLCETLWMITFYWYASVAYRPKEVRSDWDKVIWSAILPHFTEKGIQSFIEHFGEDYYNALGNKEAETILKSSAF